MDYSKLSREQCIKLLARLLYEEDSAPADPPSRLHRRRHDTETALTLAAYEEWLRDGFDEPASVAKPVTTDQQHVPYGGGYIRRTAYIENPFYQPCSPEYRNRERNAKLKREKEKEEKRRRELERIERGNVAAGLWWKTKRAFVPLAEEDSHVNRQYERQYEGSVASSSKASVQSDRTIRPKDVQGRGK